MKRKKAIKVAEEMLRGDEDTLLCLMPHERAALVTLLKAAKKSRKRKKKVDNKR